MPNAIRATLLSALAPLIVSACGGSAPPPAAPPPAASAGASSPPPVASAPPPAASAPSAAPTQEAAHKLAIAAAACWFGGAWGDALGEAKDVREANSEARCHDLEKKVWETEDKTRFEQLRALESNAVGGIIARVDSTAKGDTVDGPRRESLVNLTTNLAEALKETMLARRAGDRVKRDLKSEPDKLSTDEVNAVGPLRSHAKLDALYKLDAGDLSKEAHALAILCALDRVEVARGLPKHLKLYAVADTFQLFFGVAVPDVPADASKKLVPGTWLKFLSDTAAAAGHPVPDKAKTPKEKDALAWGGMLEGFSEKLKAQSDGVAATTDLNKVTAAVLHRLEAEYKSQQAAEATLQPKTAPKK
jgi:hypothetical protein